MTTTLQSTRGAAKTAALGYLALFVLAVFANFAVLERVLAPGDAGATAEALRSDETLFRFGLVAFLGIAIIDVVVAWALYVLFRPVRPDLALLSAWFRLTYTVVLAAALVFLHQAVTGLSQADADVLAALQSFEFAWVAGLAAFGAHLILMGRLVRLPEVDAPGWLGWTLMVAGGAYIADTLAHILLTDYERFADALLVVVALPSVVGEFGLMVWLWFVATGRRRSPGSPVEPADARVRDGDPGAATPVSA